jgi:hypothetical protein
MSNWVVSKSILVEMLKHLAGNVLCCSIIENFAERLGRHLGTWFLKSKVSSKGKLGRKLLTEEIDDRCAHPDPDRNAYFGVAPRGIETKPGGADERCRTAR